MITKTMPLVLVPACFAMRRFGAARSMTSSDIAQPWVADVTRDDSMTAMARRVLAEAPAERFALAGLSMGGYVAQAIMREAPERVERVALLDTSAMADTPEQTARRHGLIDLAEKGDFKGVTPRLLPLFVHPDRLSDKPLTDAVMAMTERVGKDAFLRQQRAIMGRPDNRPNLPKINCPALVLCGRQDQMTPLAWNEEIASLIPGARLEIIEDCGHLTTMERPWETSVALRQWLTE